MEVLEPFVEGVAEGMVRQQTDGLDHVQRVLGAELLVPTEQLLLLYRQL